MLALLAATALAGGLAACGGASSPSAQSLLDETFKSHKPIDSGRIELSFALSPVGPGGLLAVEAPFSVRLTGPFQSLGAGQLPRFALQLSLTTTGHTLRAGVTSTGGRLFVELEGVPFAVPASTVRAFQQGYAETIRTASGKGLSTFASLGIAPGEWLAHPALAGAGRVAGADTVHIVAGMNIARLLADAEKLFGAGRPLGLGAGGSLGLGAVGPLGLGAVGRGSEPLSRAQLAALASSVRSARVEVYTGTHDHLLRRLSMRAAISTTALARATLGGLRGATLSLVLQLADLNHPQRIAPPSNPRPVSQLVALLERLGLVKGSRASGCTTPGRPSDRPLPARRPRRPPRPRCPRPRNRRPDGR